MDPKLEYCGNYIEIRDFHHYIDDEKNGNPYNCSFDIIATCAGNFWLASSTLNDTVSESATL